MIDPWHLEAYGVNSVNYNRDVEIFPVLRAMMEKISGTCPYKSPTDMGVNMAGNCIVDDEICREAANMEIIRRYYDALCNKRKGLSDGADVEKIRLLMNMTGITVEDRTVIAAANEKSEKENGTPATAICLPNGKIVTGKTSRLLGASSAMLLNALKVLAGIPDDTLLISPEIIEPVQELKTRHLGNYNPRLHTDEVLVALSIAAVASPVAKKALRELDNLRGSDAHSSVIIAPVDENVMKKLGIHITCEPKYQTKKLYHG
jgi:uncharacterized protein (UPF0371 family)